MIIPQTILKELDISLSPIRLEELEVTKPGIRRIPLLGGTSLENEFNNSNMDERMSELSNGLSNSEYMIGRFPIALQSDLKTIQKTSGLPLNLLFRRITFGSAKTLFRLETFRNILGYSPGLIPLLRARLGKFLTLIKRKILHQKEHLLLWSFPCIRRFLVSLSWLPNDTGLG